MSEKVGISQVGKPKVNLHLQQLKVVHHVYKGKDI